MSVIVVEVLAYSIITTIALYQIHVMGTEVKQMANVYMPLFTATESVRQQIQNERLNLKDIIFVGDRVVYDKESEETFYAARARYIEASIRINDEISSSVELIESSSHSSDNVSKVISEFRPLLLDQLSKIHSANRLNNRRVDKVFQHVEDGSFLMGMELLDGIAESEEILTRELDNLFFHLLELKSASVDYAIRVERTSSRMTLLVSFLSVCIVIAVFFLVVKRNLSRPLHALVDAINSFDALQDPPETLEDKELAQRGDELGMVARSFNRLKHDLRAQGKALSSAKEAAENADRAKSHFLAAASHDLRQPLHALGLFASTLSERIGEEDAPELVSRIQQSTASLSTMMDALLDMSRLDAGAIEPIRSEFEIGPMIERLVNEFSQSAEEKGLVLEWKPTRERVRSDQAEGSQGGRSEERRVGKECRSRWSPYH